MGGMGDQRRSTMTLDPAHCYQAVLSRDRRFDGRFFAGVVTTGVYCRPICPVKPAKPQNVRWFACAAAAEAAGFRPCRRCRPETAPGTPAWTGTSAVVSRALRLIAAGALDDGAMEGFASRLGVGTRQLRRLFGTHLGASPMQVARARRVHFARALIDETDLPMAEVAFAAGFGSVRDFNYAVRATFGRSPTELRRARGARSPRADGAGLAVRLPYRPPLDWSGLLAFLAPRATPGVEAVADGVYRRTIAVGDARGTIEVRAAPREPHLLMRVRLARAERLLQVVEHVRRLFDLDADPALIANHLARSRVLAPLVARRRGLRVPGAWDGFELAVRAVLGQQVTVRGATTLAGRVVRAFGTPLDQAQDGLTHLFPQPEALADADLAAIGLPRARAATIRALAAAVARGDLVLEASRGLEDAVARLVAIPGIGTWTAQYVAMRALGEPDAFPAGDLGLRRALANGAGPLPPARVAELAEAWRPWRAYAALHLWTGLAGERGYAENGMFRARHTAVASS